MEPEGFLRLDLDATFTAHITIQMAPAIDASLVVDTSTWLQRGYDILDDMVSRGNLVAVQLKSELRQLQTFFPSWVCVTSSRQEDSTRIIDTARYQKESL